MALSGTVSKVFSTGYTLRTEWSATQNIAGNYSTVNCTHKLVIASAYSLYIGARDNSCIVGGISKTFRSAAISASSGRTITLGTTSHKINHNSDGTATVSLSTTFYPKATISGKYVGSVTASGTITLNTIPRTSTVSCNSFNIGDSTTITISRASSSFTHTLSYSFGSASGTIATKTASVSVGWTADGNALYAQIPRAMSGTGTITCQTYSGNTLVGTSTCGFTAYAKTAECRPTVSATIVDTNSSAIALTGDSSKIIKYISKPRVTMSTTFNKSSVAASSNPYLIYIGDDQNSYSQAYTFSNGIANGSVSARATDSRNLSTTATYNLSSLNRWVEYVKLALARIQFSKTESTSTTITLKANGNYFNGNFGSQSNTLTLKYRYKISGGTWGNYINITPTLVGNTFVSSTDINNMPIENQYEFEVVAEDKAMLVSSGTYVLPQGIGVFRIGNGYVAVNGDLRDRYGTRMLNGMSIYQSGGSLDPNTTLEETVLTNTNTPDSGFWYVKTTWYGDKTVTANRTQMAYPYNRIAPVMFRYFNNNEWSDWNSADIVEYIHEDMSGRIHYSNGLLIQWGRAVVTPSAANTVTTAVVTFPVFYDEVPKVNADPQVQYPNIVTCSVGGGTTTALAKQQMIIYMTRTNTVATNFQWFAIGYKDPF